jgi:hypothetical protein
VKQDSVPEEPVSVPLRYPTALIFMDESGSRASASRFFVMGAAKARKPGALARGVQAVRDRNDFRGEFKFSEITKGTMCAYFDLVDELALSDAHLAACVVNRDVYDPFPKRAPWEVQLEVASQLLVGCINRRELVSVLLDAITTPVGIALDDRLRDEVNRRLRTTAVVTAALLESRSTDGLQIADLVAGAVAFDRRQRAGDAGRSPSYTSPKGQVALRLMTAFGRRDFDDGREGRLNIATLRTPKRPYRSPKVTAETSVQSG